MGQVCASPPSSQPTENTPCAAWHALPLQRWMGLGTEMQGKGGRRYWLWMLNKQFLLTANPGTCSHHVTACDDLLSTKHDQAISGAVSLYLNSNGGSLSICLLLNSKRSIGLCIFSLMNSLFPIFFFPFSEVSQKNKRLFLFFPLYIFFEENLFFFSF